ncbi:hypothetical protein [Streptomyces sp. FR-008]|uniref:hypothetical protein n=1 Tax=Streptomyces sp. FR-008 TaxID=206662 RepID=UPI0007225B51|nr:hypothetical protein [Streptomyces sp. FR-008]ALM38219.1 hypothetical protein SFR_1604 [Streptomyces sp. FR-008]KAF0795863.1 hypothetical protein P405_00445 [Streptomyces sp. FR-008]
MNDQQPPSPHEPTLAEFREFLLDTAREHPQPGFWRGTMQEGVTRIFVDTIDTYLAHRAEQAPADNGWGDTLSRSNLVSVARAHRNATRPERAGQGDLDRLLDDLADEFDLADVRIVRGVAAALADAMPRIAHQAREQGKSPDEIAQAAGYTSSRITQFIRQERERRAAAGEQ